MHSEYQLISLALYEETQLFLLALAKEYPQKPAHRRGEEIGCIRIARTTSKNSPAVFKWWDSPDSSTLLRRPAGVLQQGIQEASSPGENSSSWGLYKIVQSPRDTQVGLWDSHEPQGSPQRGKWERSKLPERISVCGPKLLMAGWWVSYDSLPKGQIYGQSTKPEAVIVAQRLSAYR